MRHSSVQRLGVFLFGVLACVAASAQDVPPDLQKLHDATVKFDRVMTWQEASAALEKIVALTPDGKKHSAAARRAALLVEIHAALGVGDVQRARKQLGSLRGLAPDAPETLRTALLVAIAAGDAKEALTAQTALGLTDEAARAALPLETKRLAVIARSAPARKLGCDDGSLLAIQPRRGTVLLLDFWSAAAPAGGAVAAEKADDAALAVLAKEMETEPAFEMLGVNSDDARELPAARKQVVTRKLPARQCYESAAGKPALRDAFGVGSGRTALLIDSRGFVRAIGSASNPGFLYAVRSAVAEARGEFPHVAPCDTNGKAAVAESAIRADGGGGARKKENAPSAGEKPSNADAEGKLREAHALRRTGHKTKARELYQRIIRDYPGTVQADEAQRFLDDMPP